MTAASRILSPWPCWRRSTPARFGTSRVEKVSRSEWAAILDSEGVEVSDWKGAVSSLGDLDQTPAARNQAARTLRQHREVLDRVSDLVPKSPGCAL